VSGSTRQSTAAARERLEALTDNTSVDLAALSGELMDVTRVLDREVSLRRILTDPATPGQAKADLVAGLLTGKVGDVTVDLLSGMVRSRWSIGRDLSDATEQLAALALIISADKANELDDVEDELFRFGRVVAGNAPLRSALTDNAATASAKAELVRNLLAGRAKAVTVALVTNLVTQPRGRSLESGLDEYARLAAGRRGRVVALVTTAVPVSDTQKERLAASLATLVGRPVHLNLDVDPAVLGGVRVQIGDEIIEGTIAGRLDSASRSLAG
jgi:F-type H+-transporting ATPase subunit delta